MKFKKVPPGEGVVWVRLAFQTFFRQPFGFAGLFAACALVYLVLFGNSRYHFPMMLWVAMYSGLGVQVLLLGKSSLRLSESGEVAAWDDMKNG